MNFNWDEAFMRMRWISGILLSLGLAVNAQTVNVRGKVLDGADKPIANATVELLRAKLKDTTGADGAYSLLATSNATRRVIEPLPGAIKLERDALLLNVAKAAPIRIGIFDLKGNLLETQVLDRASPGTYRLNLEGRFGAENLLFIKVMIGETMQVLPFVPLARGGKSDGMLAPLLPLSPSSPLSPLSETSPRTGTILAKTAANVDTLRAAASGYQTQTLPIASLDLTQDIKLISCTVPTPPTASDAVTLDMAVTGGPPTYLGSGFIYGLAEDGKQPPTALLSDIKVKGMRAGRGVSEGCGQAAWNLHFKVMKAYYSRAKEVGATLLLLVSDDYGYFCTWPGDGGDWSGFTTFMGQLIDSAKANGMTGPDVRWELWNEPELDIFWKGTQAQWLETFKHAYQQIRAAIPSAVIEGPSLATGPGGAWMNTFLDYAKANNVVPDYLTWHEEGGGADPVADLATLSRGLSSRGITNFKGFDANEYGTTGEQNPGHSAWYLARFDRAGIQGLRGNWSDPEFFSNMGDLVAANWKPNSQYWIYKRYADQTGLKVNTTAGSQVDAVGYADASTSKSIIVVGNKGGVTGSVNVVIKNVPAWLQSAGSTKVLLEKMPTGSGALAAPVVVSNASVAVTCNTLIVTINWATATDGYVLSLSPN